jgi:hypothetical protein
MNPLRDIEEGLIDGDWGFFCAVQTVTHALDLAGFRDVPKMRTDTERPLSYFALTRVGFCTRAPTCSTFSIAKPPYQSLYTCKYV